VAEGALDLQAAPEADEIAGRADTLVGHGCCLRAAERFVNTSQKGCYGRTSESRVRRGLNGSVHR
jgi:hypothetical protein